ncbi:hypothetical protein [Amycolatopsis anabasis]|uniref:hypothetical protein n=1 Tax=Amycolatopsis anabasis TaxID=1840409 RepID=UPI001FE7A419|nr:hypothetical protein [Amycolatopsis anabasis]
MSPQILGEDVATASRAAKPSQVRAVLPNAWSSTTGTPPRVPTSRKASVAEP